VKDEIPEIANPLEGEVIIQGDFSDKKLPNPHSFKDSINNPADTVNITNVDYSTSSCFFDMRQPVTHYCPVTKNAFCAGCSSPSSPTYPCKNCNEKCKDNLVKLH
jgi:hypothetical protein